MAKELATQGKLQSPVPVGVLAEKFCKNWSWLAFMSVTRNGGYPKESLLRTKMASTVTQRTLEEMEAFHTKPEGTWLTNVLSICEQVSGIPWSQCSRITHERPAPAAQKVSISYQCKAGMKNACANDVPPVAHGNMDTEQSTDEISSGAEHDLSCPHSDMTKWVWKTP